MMNLVVFIVTSVGVLEGGGLRSTCPALCRCEGVGMLSVDCVDAGLRSVPSNLSGFASSLDLSMNRLSALSAHVFSSFHSLHELRLAGNSLSEIEDDAFTGLTGLKLLNLQNNHLRRVPSLKNLRNLRSLHLDANFISCPPPSCFKGLRSLRHLWLEDNHLTEVPVVALSSLTELQALTLALNSISSIPDRAFAALRQLLVLHLHDNRIHSLGQRSFTGLINLENLDLSFNRIHSFPTAIRSLSSLRALNLQNNNIPVVPENAFTGNPSIETINIWNNPLHTVGPSCFQLLPELRTLCVSTASPSLSLRGSGSADGPDAVDLSAASRGGPNLQLRVPQQQQHTHRVSELQLKVLSCVGSTSLQDSSGLSTSCLDSLHLIFIISVVLNLLVLLSILLLPSAPRPPSSLCLPSVILWFRLLAGLSGSSVVSADWFCGSGLETDPGSGVFLSSLCSEVCVFIMMGAVVEAKTRTRSCFQISGVVCCSLALTLVVMGTSLWTHSSALVLFNTFCFLFMILTHVTRRPRQDLRGDREAAASLTVLLTHALIFFSASLLGLSSLLSPDVSTCAVLIVSSLPCCVDPLILILGPRSGFLQQTLPELKKSQRLSVSL